MPSKKGLATSNLQFLPRNTQKSPLANLYLERGDPQKGGYFSFSPSRSEINKNPGIKIVSLLDYESESKCRSGILFLICHCGLLPLRKRKRKKPQIFICNPFCTSGKNLRVLLRFPNNSSIFVHSNNVLRSLRLLEKLSNTQQFLLIDKETSPGLGIS